MAGIFKAYDIRLQRTVALKMILDRNLASKEAVRRFRTEAETAARLNHPGIVPVHELGVDESDQVYFTMKLVQGRTFLEILKADGVPKRPDDIYDRLEERHPHPPLVPLQMNRSRSVCVGYCAAISAFIASRKGRIPWVGEYCGSTTMRWATGRVSASSTRTTTRSRRSRPTSAKARLVASSLPRPFATLSKHSIRSI